MRSARLAQRISRIGYQVWDLGDLPQPPEVEDSVGASDNVKRHGNAQFLKEISETCNVLAKRVESLLQEGYLPIVLGGDHAIAAGSISGVSKFFKAQEGEWGLLWFDAHADMNTPETSPSGHVHGMPLAALLGYGDELLTHIGGFAPKVDKRFCVHIGARDLDEGERRLIKALGLRCFTMRDIDEQGMAAVMNQALGIVSQAAGGFAVTFDIDVLDPGDAPGSGTLVRGGLTYREAHLALEKVADAKGLRFIEMVEINTALDINNRTAELGVELILSALGKSIL
jgi:arginase